MKACHNQELFLLLNVSARKVGRVSKYQARLNLMEDDMMERLLAFVLAGALVAPQIGVASERGFNNESGRQ